jgi:HEAT repeat protein
VLRDLSADKDRDVQNEATVALARISRRKDLTVMHKLIEANNRDVGALAMEAAARFWGSDALCLLRQFAKDPRPEVRGQAAKELGRFNR